MNIQIISRGKGKSAVASAAYRAGEKIKNEYDGHIHNYTRKKGVVHTEILLPENAPPEYNDRAVLWNAVERIEKNKNAQLAREIEVALPRELTFSQNKSLIMEYVKNTFVAAGMCADVCIHDTGEGNPHAHIMLTMRHFSEDRTWGAKSKKEYILDAHGNKIRLPSGEYKSRKISAVDWNEQTKAEEWREAWANILNKHLAKINHPEKLDHRSYKRQGVEQIPTIHLGVVAHQLEKRGIRTERGDINRAIAEVNKQLRQIRARIAKMENGLDEMLTEKPLARSTQTENVSPKQSLTENTIPENAPPKIPQTTPAPQEVNLIESLLAMLNSQAGKTRLQKITPLKVASQALAYLQTHNITTLPQLRENVTTLRARHNEINDKSKKSDRRLKTLHEHIKQSEAYQGNRAVFVKYKELPAKKQPKFYESHREEISQYEAAEHYLKAVMNGKTPIPYASWKSEAAKLVTAQNQLTAAALKLKEDVRQVEVIKASVEHILAHADSKEQFSPMRDNITR